MQDRTIVTLAVIGAMTFLGTVYFYLVHQDGTIFSSLAVMLSGLAGYHVGRGSKD